MPYLHPIEARTARLNDIPAESGNLIFDIESKSIFYDNNENQRIKLVDVITFATDDDRLNCTDPVENKVYIVLSVGTIYTYYNRQWVSLTSKTQVVYTTFFVSSSGYSGNSGLSQFEPLDSIASVISKYTNTNTYIIYLLQGTYDGDINISNYNTVHLIAASGNTVILNGNITLSNVLDFHMENVQCKSINASKSFVTLSNIQIDDVETGIKADNSLVTIDSSFINGATITAIDSDNSSTVTLKSCGGSSNEVAYTASNGATINIIDTSIVATTDSIINNVGHIYKDTDKTDIKTQEYIAETLSIQEV